MRHISRSRDSTKLRDWLPCQSNTLTSLAGLQIRIFTKCCITLNYRTRLNILKSALFLSRPLYLVSIYCLEMSSYVCSFFHAIPDFTHQRFLDFRVLSPKYIGYNLRHIIASWYLYIIYLYMSAIYYKESWDHYIKYCRSSCIFQKLYICTSLSHHTLVWLFLSRLILPSESY